MIKKIAFVIAVSLVACVQVTPVLAAPNPDTGPGCGLGKLAWADYSNQKDIAPQVMMATTNGTFGSQTFGISSGTSGCTNDGKVMSQHQATLFAEINFESLAQDMAQGHGEHLASLATLVGVPEADQAAFFALTQEKYGMLIQSGETTPVAMLTAIYQAMAGHPVLAKVSTSH